MAIVFRHVGFEWPNGQTLFEDISFSIAGKTYALVGPNGAGKTTLVRLIAGELEATEGSIARGDVVRIFRQSEDPPNLSIEEYLASEEPRDESLLHSFLGTIPPGRSCLDLSGGEWTRVRLAKAAASGVGLLILDEPTNHLDRSGRAAVHEFLGRFPGTILLISHDRELLEEADEILELGAHGVNVFGGGWSEYVEERDRERERLHEALERARQKRDSSLRERREKIDRQAKRQRRGEETADKRGLPRIIIGGLKRAAQVTQGRVDNETMESVNAAVTEAWEAYRDLKIDPVMYARLPEAIVPRGRTLIEAEGFNFRFDGAREDLWSRDLTFSFRGSARIAIQGANGSGKSTLLKLLLGESLPGSSRGFLKRGPVHHAVLDQECALLDRDASVLDNARATAKLAEADMRGLLAMFLFKGEAVRQRAGELSGGERLRAALAKVLTASPPANALFLDEPTNNLDASNIEFLEDLLRQYKGALIVVSHDRRFLDRLDLTDEIALE